MKQKTHGGRNNIQNPDHAKSKRTQRNAKPRKIIDKTGTQPPEMEKAVEYWWICAELARFLGTTTKEEFRKVCRRGVRYVNAILQNIRRMMAINPALRNAEVFLSSEGWDYAQKLWIMEYGDQNLAMCILTKYEMAGHGCNGEDMTQEALLRWNCLELFQELERSGKDEAHELGIQYPPTNFTDPNIPQLLAILEAVEKPTEKNTPKPKKQKNTRGRNIPRPVKRIVAAWLNGPECPQPGSDWATNFNDFLGSDYYLPILKPFCQSQAAFERLVEATRKSIRRGRL